MTPTSGEFDSSSASARQDSAGRPAGEFARACLFFDLELDGRGRVADAGAVLDGNTWRAPSELRGGGRESAVLRALTQFGRAASFVAGHNVLDHDLPAVARVDPRSALLALPVVDTLFLAPLARPQRPYHKLVKDYKLVGGERSDPHHDCRLAMMLFGDCWHRLDEEARADADIVSLYRSCFRDDVSASGLRLDGTGRVLEALGARLLDQREAVDVFARLVGDRGCAAGVKAVVSGVLTHAPDRPAVAFALAWIRVAGTHSILPRWVHRRFPAAARIIEEIRCRSCGNASCAYCSAEFDPRGQLRRHFPGFSSFRSTPATPSGASLQESIVVRGLERRSLLAVLPTGGGKSLCFQLPALVHHQRTGALTVVISPLQALMKDQVENLNERLATADQAATLNGMLTMPERHDVLESVRHGSYALLYVSPEQLRSPSFRSALAQREVCTWVFDEAHCISKWGHDFRPDYWYAARFIREFTREMLGEGARPAPVACFTATAKFDVRAEIVEHLRAELGHDVEVLAADRVDRENLHYRVEEVTTARKVGRLNELLREHLGPPEAGEHRGAAVVYASRRKRTEKVARQLAERGWTAAHFHAGLEPPEKRAVQDAFVEGRIPVIVATNAFGMGIDKSNVRLVVHIDIPGSLESYLQEAGRAGRDGEDAHCVLLFGPNDLEDQFDLTARGRLTRRDIAQILRAIRGARKGDADEIVVSPGELLRVPEVDVSFDERDRDAATRVKIAISWLERAALLLRDENRTFVFQGVARVTEMTAVREAIEPLDASPVIKRRYLEVMDALISADPREGIDADALACLPSFRGMVTRADGDRSKVRSASQAVLRTLFDLHRIGLVKKCLYFSAYVRHKIASPSRKRLETLRALELATLDELREQNPDLVVNAAIPLSVPQLVERMRFREFDVLPRTIVRLVQGWSRIGVGSHSQVLVQAAGRDRLELRFAVDWDGLRDALERRWDVAETILDVLGRIADRKGGAGQRLVEFALEDVQDALSQRFVFASVREGHFEAIEKTLLYLDDHDVIRLQKGLAVFRQAMTLRLQPAHVRGYREGDFRPLRRYYEERTFQIHAVGRYVEQAAESLDQGRRYVQDYFGLREPEFRGRHFPNDDEAVRRATSQASYWRIVEELDHDAQEAIVAASPDRNLLVLAGPGSGKTRVVVHRCAYLLRVLRVRPESLLVVCFNRSAMHELRIRLRDLVGALAGRVAVHTYHSLALRLTGRSLASRVRQSADDGVDFDALLDEANDRLSGRRSVVGVEPDALRDRLLSGFEHVLVDEYQDIDERQYRLLSHIASRRGGGEDDDQKATILAVGDDDQSIYGFREANVAYLRRFEEDFGAERRYLVENFRSTARIVAAANAVIRHNADRLKTAHPIRVNEARAADPPGGVLETLDPLTRGHVSELVVESRFDEAAAVVAEVERLRRVGAGTDWDEFAVLGRWHRDLHAVRALLVRLGIPVRRAVRSGLPPLSRIRELARLLEYLGERGDDGVDLTTLRADLAEICGHASVWTGLADRELAGLQLEFGNEPVPAAEVSEEVLRMCADHQRSHLIGRGVLVSTVHAAKGLEFPHVLVLGGTWGLGSVRRGPGRRPSAPEEERRLFYVAMSRARHSLTLFDRRDAPLPLVREAQGTRRREVQVAEAFPDDLRDVEYSVLGMRDLYIDHAGTRAVGEATLTALAQLRTYDLVTLVEDGQRIDIRSLTGVVLGRLSGAACLEWRAHVQSGGIQEVRVLGMVQRRRELVGEEFRDRIVRESWEVPILEVRHRVPRVQ